MNKVILMGRLTSDPKMDWTRSEDSKQYATYTLAVNRRFKRNGEQEADFINCVAWGAMAEFAEKYMKKRCYVCGSRAAECQKLGEGRREALGDNGNRGGVLLYRWKEGCREKAGTEQACGADRETNGVSGAGGFLSD